MKMSVDRPCALGDCWMNTRCDSMGAKFWSVMILFAVLPDAFQNPVLVEDESLRPPVEQLHRLELGEQFLANQDRCHLQRRGTRGVDVRFGNSANQIIRSEESTFPNCDQEWGS